MLRNGGEYIRILTNMLSHIITVIYRLVADILNDIALCLDLLAPIFPMLFMTIICASSVTKVCIVISIVGYRNC